MRGRRAKFSHAPEGVLEEIMSWLPPESLRRFQLVQKSWYLLINALMNDPEFVAKHLGNMKRKTLSSSTFRCSFLFTGEQDIGKEDDGHGNNDNKEVGYFLALGNDDRGGNDYIPFDTDFLREIKPDMDNRYYSLECHCDGVICLSIDDTVCLLNPALREMKIIHCSWYENREYSLCAAGFGYDSRAREYKAVVVGIHARDRIPPKAEVYSLRTNSWREIECGVEFSSDSHEGVYCRGVVYWSFGDLAWKLLCFDFTEEAFRHVPLPRMIPSMFLLSKLSVWNDSVALLVYTDCGFLKVTIDVWVLDGGSYSWTKHVMAERRPNKIKRPLGFWNDVKLVLEDKDGAIKLQHLGSPGVRLRHISGRLDRCCVQNNFVIYDKSFVSVLRKEGRRSVVEQV